MKTLKKSSLCIILLLVVFNAPVFSFSYIPVDKTVTTGDASISALLSSETKVMERNTFLSDEAISLNFQLNIAAEDIAIQSELYLIAAYNNSIFMRTQSGQWQPWNDQKPVLEATIKKKLQEQENISVLDNYQLPIGEYLFIAAYKTISGDIKYNRDAITFIVSDKSMPALHRIKSSFFLNEFLSKAQDNARYSIYSEFDNAQFSGVTTAIPPVSNSATSQTNLQETGVDESDTIKTSDNILFALEQCSTGIEKTITDEAAKNDSNSGETFLVDYPQQNKTCLSSYQLQESPASAIRLAQTELDTNSYSPGSLFLNEGKASKSSSQLIWISDTMQQNIWSFWGSPGYWTDNQVTLQFFDISNREKLTPETKVSLDGALIASRRIGDQLYLVTRKNHYSIMPLINSALPEISFNDGIKRSLVKPTDCYVPASTSNQTYDGTIITITTLSISDPTSYQSTCVTGNIETAYVSTEALYLASSRYPYHISGNEISYDQAAQYNTEIHKFSFSNNHIDYKGSGSVSGHLGWEMDKKPFRMGEHNGILKVATSLGSSWGTNSTSRVGVLRENTESHTLDEISHIDNLGKPGEKLYAARFIGNRGYLVTFRVTDPLYLLDFSEPESPQILGELEINGYSDYLHPIGENFLLGIGKDAVADSSFNNTENRGAWYQGVKLSLFDVSDGSHLKEVQSIVIGKRGTSSAVLSDHHALAWLANSDEADSYRLAIPINEHATESEWQNNYDHPSDYYSWTKTGAYVFDINTGESPALKQTGILVTESLENGDQQSYSSNERIVLQGDTLHFIHDNSVYSSTINN
ncbi:MAG: beta-propeller domain-containing protein [gamma proteobacterium symbiont of Taylorina sp.]|nr:beta-propeller domain-containing protein [gamma proteobacterium symbiont of Taylorina sp.]